ncbi:hypothetical protein SGFS_070820 [Streptomyces graminofaciens]|uniref:Uncharacterized protein n=1 Tax=Streptomyces graminofaciens TaxID=68212 RepID=A0ABN5VTG1_9ACTN|nr:hypothetical protein SGFS_070820 [Streptomyces graminofaciens]
MVGTRASPDPRQQAGRADPGLPGGAGRAGRVIGLYRGFEAPRRVEPVDNSDAVGAGAYRGKGWRNHKEPTGGAGHTGDRR